MISYLLSGWRVFVPDANGQPIYRGRVYFYDASTSEPSTVYADKDQVTALGTYVDVDNHGYLPAVWLSASHLYKVVVKQKIQVDPETWNTLWEINDVGNPFLTSGNVDGESAIAVNTISDLRALDPLDAELPEYVYVMGWSTPGDTGSPMLFKWTPNASGNDGHWINPNVTGYGAWEQLFDGDIDPRKFGAIPNSADSCDVSIANCMLYASEPHTYDPSDTLYHVPKTVRFSKGDGGIYKLNAAFDFTTYKMLSQYDEVPVPVIIGEDVFFDKSVTLGEGFKIESTKAVSNDLRITWKESYAKSSWYGTTPFTNTLSRVLILDNMLTSAPVSLSGKVVLNLLNSLPSNVTLTNCVLINPADGVVSPDKLNVGDYGIEHEETQNPSTSKLLVYYGQGGIVEEVFAFENGVGKFMNAINLPKGWNIDNDNFFNKIGPSSKHLSLKTDAELDLKAKNGNASDISFDKMKVTSDLDLDGAYVNGDLFLAGYIRGGSIGYSTAKIERTVTIAANSSTGSISLESGEKGYVLVISNGTAGTVNITETNTGVTRSLTRDSGGNDLVYCVIRIGAMFYRVV